MRNDREKKTDNNKKKKYKKKEKEYNSKKNKYNRKKKKHNSNKKKYDKKETEHNKKEKKSNKQKMEYNGRRWRECFYNCPYLIAIVVTSLLVMIGSKEIGIRAVAAEAEVTVRQAIRFGSTEKKSSVDFVSNQASDGEGVENKGENDANTIQNAGECRGSVNDKKEIIEQINKNCSKIILENIEKNKTGVTKFEYYEAREINSVYYSDAGKVAITTEYPYTKENISYFNNAAFLGDSRTLGISDYAGLGEADFYCDSGMTIFKLLEESGVTYQKTGEKVNLTQVLQEKQYGKIYIMLGMNELGYGNTEMYLEQYRKVVDQIREWQPDAVIYIMANLHVSREKNNMETEFNNVNINDKNAASALLANGNDIFYLDVNPLFTDGEGFLNDELSFDGVHLYAQYYDQWREFLLEHAVKPAESQEDTEE